MAFESFTFSCLMVLARAKRSLSFSFSIQLRVSMAIVQASLINIFHALQQMLSL